jgi:hypothetical protein
MNRQEPLSAEEQSLAQWLGGGRDAAQPSPEVDAAVLAMARDAIRAGPEPHVASAPLSALPASRRRRRRFSGFAIAASMMLAVGVAWQMRPLPPSPALPVVAGSDGNTSTMAPTSAPIAAIPATPAIDAADSSASNGPDLLSPAHANLPPASAKNAAAQPVTRRAAPAATTEAARQQAETQPFWPEPAPPVAVTAAPMIQAPTPPAPPAPAAPAAAFESRGQEAAEARLDAVTVTGSRAAMPMARAQPRLADAQPPPQVAAEKAAPLNRMDSAAEVEADTRLSKRQWLKKIRTRQDAGDLETARASLQRFTEMHPGVAIPRDLQPLLEP